MKLIVGLGNPGRKYEGTRHNVGYMVLDDLASRNSGNQGAGRKRRDFQGEVSEVQVAGQRCLLLWPHTFMNVSGASVLAARDFYKLENEELLVVCDDFNLPLAKLRCRAAGSSGGQRGLENVIARLSTDRIARLRIGIGPVPDGRDPADFVLDRFRKQEWAEVEPAIWRAAQAVATWVESGTEACMNQYN